MEPPHKSSTAYYCVRRGVRADRVEGVVGCDSCIQAFIPPVLGSINGCATSKCFPTAFRILVLSCKQPPSCSDLNRDGRAAVGRCRHDTECFFKESVGALSCGTPVIRIGRRTWLDLVEYLVLVCSRRSAVVHARRCRAGVDHESIQHEREHRLVLSSV